MESKLPLCDELPAWHRGGERQKHQKGNKCLQGVQDAVSVWKAFKERSVVHTSALTLTASLHSFFLFQSIFIEYFVKHDTYNTVRHRIHFLDDIPNHNNPPCCTDIHFSFLIWKKKPTLKLLFVLVYYSSEITESPSSLSDLKQVAK